MKFSKLEKDTILNGTNSLAVVKKEGIVYRVDPVPLVSQLIFTPLYAQTPYSIHMADYLDQDYKVLNINQGHPTLQGNNSANPEEPSQNRINYTQFEVRKANHPQIFMTLSFDGYNAGYKDIIICPDSTIFIKPTFDMDALTLTLQSCVLDKLIQISTLPYHTPVANADTQT